MMFTCEKCGWWTDVNGVCVCGYSGRPTVRHDSCMAWKTTIVTNADRIRAMTDEELAEFLTTEDMCELICAPAPPHCDGKCKQKMLEWLNEEVKDV